MTRLLRCLISGISVLMVFAVAACDSTPTSTSSATIQSITIAGTAPTAGQSSPFTATARTSEGVTQNVTTQAAWSSSTPCVASVGASTGIVTGVLGGQRTTLSASFGGATGSLDVVVGGTSAPTALTVSGAAPTAGQSSQFVALLVFGNNCTQTAVTSTSTAWVSSDTNVATVNPTTGLVTGVAAGTVTITATHTGVTPSVTGSVTIIIAGVPPPAGSGTNLVPNCDRTVADASVLTRTLFWPAFGSGSLGGSSISAVGLFLTSKDVAGTYSATLTISVNNITDKQVTASVVVPALGSSVFTTFTPSTPSTGLTGKAVRFGVTATGPGELRWEGNTGNNCELITADGTGTTQIVGPKVPIRIIGN